MKLRKLKYLACIFCISIIVFTINSIYITTNSGNVLSKVIVLDAGHGGEDGGAVGKDGTTEKDLNLSITLKVKEILEKNKFKVILIRDNDSQLDSNETTMAKRKVSDINKRIEIINKSNADMVISIHMNSFPQQQYYGWQTFYKRNCTYSKDVAINIQKCIGDNVDISNKRVAMEIRDVKIIEKSIIPAVLIECGFLSNQEECERLNDTKYQDMIANGIAQGIIGYYEN